MSNQTLKKKKKKKLHVTRVLGVRVPFKMPLQGSLNLVWGNQTYIKKKNCMKTPLQGSLNLVWANPYKKNCMKTPLQVFLNAAIGMELELHELEFHAFFFFLIRHNSILLKSSFEIGVQTNIVSKHGYIAKFF